MAVGWASWVKALLPSMVSITLAFASLAETKAVTVILACFDGAVGAAETHVANTRPVVTHSLPVAVVQAHPLLAPVAVEELVALAHPGGVIARAVAGAVQGARAISAVIVGPPLPTAAHTVITHAVVTVAVVGAQTHGAALPLKPPVTGAFVCCSVARPLARAPLGARELRAVFAIPPGLTGTPPIGHALAMA